jgi:hypothetical protein
VQGTPYDVLPLSQNKCLIKVSTKLRHLFWDGGSMTFCSAEFQNAEGYDFDPGWVLLDGGGH